MTVKFTGTANTYPFPACSYASRSLELRPYTSPGFAPSRRVGRGMARVWRKGLRSGRDGGTLCTIDDRCRRLVALRPAPDRIPVMTQPRTVADVLSGQVVLEVESIDRLYLNVWQLNLQHGAGPRHFLGHRGHALAMPTARPR